MRALDRLGVVLDGTTGAIKQWLYRDPQNPVLAMADQAGFVRTTAKMDIEPLARGVADVSLLILTAWSVLVLMEEDLAVYSI